MIMSKYLRQGNAIWSNILNLLLKYSISIIILHYRFYHSTEFNSEKTDEQNVKHDTKHNKQLSLAKYIKKNI